MTTAKQLRIEWAEKEKGRHYAELQEMRSIPLAQISLDRIAAKNMEIARLSGYIAGLEFEV